MRRCDLRFSTIHYYSTRPMQNTHHTLWVHIEIEKQTSPAYCGGLVGDMFTQGTRWLFTPKTNLRGENAQAITSIQPCEQHDFSGVTAARKCLDVIEQLYTQECLNIFPQWNEILTHFASSRTKQLCQFGWIIQWKDTRRGASQYSSLASSSSCPLTDARHQDNGMREGRTTPHNYSIIYQNAFTSYLHNHRKAMSKWDPLFEASSKGMLRAE